MLSPVPIWAHAWAITPVPGQRAVELGDGVADGLCDVLGELLGRAPVVDADTDDRVVLPLGAA